MGVYSQGEGHGATFSMTVPMIRRAFARTSITSLNLKLSQALLQQSHKSQHSNYNDQRRMSQKSQTSAHSHHKVPSLDLSTRGGGGGSADSNGRAGTIDGSGHGDLLNELDDSDDQFNSAGHPQSTGSVRRKSRQYQHHDSGRESREPVSSSEGTHRSGGTGTHRSKTR